FETREGRQGLLQFMGYTENPRGVKIRYKLVQSAGKSATSNEAKTEKLNLLRLQQANEQLQRSEALVNQKAISQEEYDSAKFARDIAAARLSDDRVDVARLKFQQAEQGFERKKDAFEKGVISKEELGQAMLAREQAKLDYEAAISATANSAAKVAAAPSSPFSAQP